MIRYIKGTYTMAVEKGIVVENASGIGFEINIPLGSPLYKHAEGDEITVFTEMVVKEDDISLYGFHNRDSLKLFNLLTTVNGIGPKGAMAVMGAMSTDDLKNAIAFGDVKEISRAPGIGKKTAERVILELKDKVGKIEESGAEIAINALEKNDSQDARTEAINALIALGYNKSEAYSAVSHVSDEGLTSEDYIKKALKSLF